jgi:predicted Zn-dependent protease
MSEFRDTPDTDLSRRRFLRHAAFAGAGALAAPLLLTPQAAEAAGLLDFMPSVADQKKMGEQAAQQVTQKYKEVFDGRLRHFNQLGQRLVAALPAQDRNTWDYKFHVLDSKEVNAFALPGGNMFMFTGLYEKLTSDDALAGVTGHEMTHVRMQHWAKAYAAEQKRALGLSALLFIFKGGGQLAQTAAGLYNQFTGLKYSRGEEDAADAGGLQNMVAAGYNPQGMIDLFQTLNRVAGSGGGMPAFLSDHPLTNDRIKATESRIVAYQGRYRFPPETPLNYRSLF